MNMIRNGMNLGIGNELIKGGGGAQENVTTKVSIGENKTFKSIGSDPTYNTLKYLINEFKKKKYVIYFSIQAILYFLTHR